MDIAFLWNWDLRVKVGVLVPKEFSFQIHMIEIEKNNPLLAQRERA